MGEIIILQHADCEGPGTIENALSAANVQVRTIRGDLGQPIPRDLGSASGLLVMGGPMGVYEHERYPFLTSELRLIEKAVHGGRPVLGICLGSQLLAAALGANVYKGATKEIGWYPVSLESTAQNDPLFEGAPQHFDGFHWHGDIFELPNGATGLAHSDLTQCQAFRYENTYGILFHMEVTQSSIVGMVETFVDELAEAGKSGKSILAETETRLPQLQSVGAGVFEQWVATLDSRAASA